MNKSANGNENEKKKKLLDMVWQYNIQMLPLELSLSSSEPVLFQGYTLHNLQSLQQSSKFDSASL